MTCLADRRLPQHEIETPEAGSISLADVEDLVRPPRLITTDDKCAVVINDDVADHQWVASSEHLHLEDQFAERERLIVKLI
jgi:hypothetical protein